jgi:predicted PurR-regulated permease PerM
MALPLPSSSPMPTPNTSAESILEPDVDPTARAEPADALAAQPDLRRMGRAIASGRSRSVGITILTLLAVLYSLFFARDFLLPITVAVLLDFLLSPVVRGLARLRLPVPVGAALVVLTLIGALGYAVYGLSEPVQRWATQAPTSLDSAGKKLHKLIKPVQQVSTTAEQAVERAAAVAPTANAPREVVVRGPSLVSRLFGTTQKLLAGLLEVFILLYFLLAAGDLFLQKLVKVIPREDDKRTVVTIAREIEASISTYLLTATFINVCEGAVVAGAMRLLHMPNAVLWGSLVAILEFVPYLGATTMVLVLGIAALTTFPSVPKALLVPGAFLAINLIQANLVTPLTLGHRLTLNPVAIFVGLAFWWFMWGVPGAFIAVPMLAALKVICDHVEPLAAIGEFLGRRDEEERRWTVRA